MVQNSSEASATRPYSASTLESFDFVQFFDKIPHEDKPPPIPYPFPNADASATIAFPFDFTTGSSTPCFYSPLQLTDSERLLAAGWDDISAGISFADYHITEARAAQVERACCQALGVSLLQPTSDKYHDMASTSSSESSRQMITTGGARRRATTRFESS